MKKRVIATLMLTLVIISMLTILSCATLPSDVVRAAHGTAPKLLDMRWTDPSIMDDSMFTPASADPFAKTHLTPTNKFANNTRLLDPYESMLVAAGILEDFANGADEIPESILNNTTPKVNETLIGNMNLSEFLETLED
jgi:hypothetical protein